MSDDLSKVCNICRRTIQEGQLYGVMIFNLESIVSTPENPEGEITVHDSVEVTTMCKHCAAKFDDESVNQLID